MKIAEKNGIFSISFGAMESTEKQNRAKGNRLSIFAGDLKQGSQETAVERKRREVREKATKVLMDKFEDDQKYEQDLDESRARIQDSQAALKEAKENAEKAAEQLEGMSKEADPEAYKSCEGYMKEQQRIMQEAEGSIIGENAYIRGAKQGKLREKYTMAHAVVAEEKILAAGSKEVMGVAVQESMEHINDLYQDNIEEAQKEKEEKEKQEERLEAIKEKQKELEQQVDAAKAEAAKDQEKTAEKTIETVTGNSDIEKELRKIQKEGELLDEEMKGLLVDSQL